MILTTGGVWFIAACSDIVNSTFVFLLGSKIKGNKKPKKKLKWRNL